MAELNWVKRLRGRTFRIRTYDLGAEVLVSLSCDSLSRAVSNNSVTRFQRSGVILQLCPEAPGATRLEPRSIPSSLFWGRFQSLRPFLL